MTNRYGPHPLTVSEAIAMARTMALKIKDSPTGWDESLRDYPPEDSLTALGLLRSLREVWQAAPGMDAQQDEMSTADALTVGINALLVRCGGLDSVHLRTKSIKRDADHAIPVLEDLEESWICAERAGAFGICGVPR